MRTTVGVEGYKAALRIATGGVLLLFFILASGMSLLAQTTTNPLSFENNYFVTGDYVVAGWTNKQVSPNHANYAIGTISVPDTLQQNAVTAGGQPQPAVQYSVPAGADIVAAVLYWQTVEKSSSAGVGALAYVNGKPVVGGLAQFKQPPSWSAGGCSGPSNGTTIVQTYRADVRPYLPIVNGVISPNTAYSVELADSGTNGSTAPFSLGATLVIVFRVLSGDYGMNAITFLDGGFSPSTTLPNMLQYIWGFYQPARLTPVVAKLTHIVGNGQANKGEIAYFNGQLLPNLYTLGTTTPKPAFPGLYNGDWDNPTWDVSGSMNSVTLSPAGVPAVTTEVDSSNTNSGCVTWGAIVFSTTVDQSNNDGVLDAWRNNTNAGYCDAGINSGQCKVGNLSDPGWVSLSGVTPSQAGQDVFIQADTMCTTLTSGGIDVPTCSGAGCTCNGSYAPPQSSIDMVTAAFQKKGINLHWDFKNYIEAPVCRDSDLTPPQLCMYPTTNTYSQPGVVPWKSGLVAIKNMPLNYSTESDCEANSDCIRIFQRGRKDSYHYVLFANRLGAPRWTFAGGTLTSAVWGADNKVTFTTSTPNNFDPSSQIGYDRLTVAGAITVPAMNGTFKVIPGNDDLHFSIDLSQESTPPPAPATAVTITSASDPNMTIYTGNAGTGSGMSDIGGADSVITLGGWDLSGAAAVNPNAGTLMHELGHTLGLTHGGYSYNSYGAKSNYVPTTQPNCKPNFQSIMSYLFQVDLLWNGSTDGSRVLDFSGRSILSLDETSAGNASGWSPTYAGTKWFTLSALAGTPATRHCDGTPKGNSPDMFEVEDLTTQFSWAGGQDVNYDGFASSLSGFTDWTQGQPGDRVGRMDLRQIGAAGSNSSAAGFNLGSGGGFNLGSGGGFNLGSGGGFNLGSGGGFNLGSGGGFNLGSGGGEDRGEINFDVANSYVRSPRFLNTTLTGNNTQVLLSWIVPTFFPTFDHYNVYRKADGDTNFTKLQPARPITGTSFSDLTTTGCTLYTYFVTTVIADPNVQAGYRESVPSNSQTITTACIFTGFASPLQTAGLSSYSGPFSIGKTLTIAWQLQDPVSLMFRNDLNLNTVLAKYAGPTPSSGKCPLPGNVNNPLLTLTLFAPFGTPNPGPFTYDQKKNKFLYNWTGTAGAQAGCWVIEVDVSFGQSPGVKAYPTTVQLK